MNIVKYICMMRLQAHISKYLPYTAYPLSHYSDEYKGRGGRPLRICMHVMSMLG